MKTYANLYPKIISWMNLYEAYRKARKGKRGKSPAASFEFNLEENLLNLHQELADKSYQPGAYHSFFIHEPKRRLISASCRSIFKIDRLEQQYRVSCGFPRLSAADRHCPGW